MSGGSFPYLQSYGSRAATCSLSLSRVIGRTPRKEKDAQGSREEENHLYAAIRECHNDWWETQGEWAVCFLLRAGLGTVQKDGVGVEVEAEVDWVEVTSLVLDEQKEKSGELVLLRIMLTCFELQDEPQPDRLNDTMRARCREGMRLNAMQGN